ncbi:putative ribonuclease 3-like [Capsicum annuum]|nr:putative ribonuclease 3-like [Capsicum annuum]
MKKLPFFLILLVVIISQHVHSQQTPELMRFVLQWPPTFCMQLNHAAQPSRCTEPILQHNLTLHGLWPSNANGYPISCHNKTNLDWRQVGGFVYLKEVTLCTDFFGTSFLSCPPKPDEGIKTCSVTGAKIRLPLPKPQK